MPQAAGATYFHLVSSLKPFTCYFRIIKVSAITAAIPNSQNSKPRFTKPIIP